MTHILVAVAWPYANGPRHVGHIAGFGIPSDIFARFERMIGNQVLMVSGTDEHGTPIQVVADKNGVTPQDIADKYNCIIEEDLLKLGLSYDIFTRTTTVSHEKVVQDVFKQCLKNGYIYEGSQEVAISPSTGRTLPDRYIEGTCPICGYTEARGDQCDQCGNELDPTDLIDPHSKTNGEVPEFKEERHYFLDLPALKDALEKYLNGVEGWRPHVLRFSQSLVEELKPRAITRDMNWGIPIPVEGWIDNPNKRLYVWFDALIGYLSASIEWAYRQGKPDEWRQWWNNPDSKTYYFMGKDNITFHSIIWPAEILAYNGLGGDKQDSQEKEQGDFGLLNMPSEVVASGFMTMSGQKFSSSRGIVIYVRDILERYQVDALRFYIAVAGPENQDSDFTWEEFARHTNEELVAGWGNLVNRVATLIYKNFKKIPSCHEELLTAEDREIQQEICRGFDKVADNFASQHQHAAISEIMRLSGLVNKYISDTEPWKIEDTRRLETVLYVAAQAVIDINIMFVPVIPHACQKIHEIFGGTGIIAPLPVMEEVHDIVDSNQTYPILTGTYGTIAQWGHHPLQSGVSIEKPAPVFTKITPEMVEDELQRLSA